METGQIDCYFSLQTNLHVLCCGFSYLANKSDSHHVPNSMLEVKFEGLREQEIDFVNVIVIGDSLMVCW